MAQIIELKEENKKLHRNQNKTKEKERHSKTWREVNQKDEFDFQPIPEQEHEQMEKG